VPPKKNGQGTGDKSIKKESMNPEQENDEELTENLYSKINNVEKEKKDIVIYLKSTLAQKEVELINLAEMLSRHQQAQEAEREFFELQLSLLRHELQENKEKFTLRTWPGKLASLEEFSMQREKLMAERRCLEEQLQKQKEEHQAQIDNLEKKAVLYNDRAMQENLSDKTKELLKENNDLRAREKQLKIENAITELLLHEITKKNVANQKVVHQLTEKSKQMQSDVEKCAKLKVEQQELLDSHSAICTELDKHATVIEVLNQTKAEAKRQRKELEEERMLRKQLKTVLEEAAVALKETLREVPKAEDSELKITVRRNQMMQKLQAVLDSAAALGNGPALTDFIPEKSTLYLSHFKTGDLGLVPRKTHTTSSKTGNLSRSAYTYVNK
uniref:Cilia- and flagella-associated protein 157 n=2 Tax=Cyprinus carpio TaxID=7962 RepID=A0A8C1HTD7_CYPCA